MRAGKVENKSQSTVKLYGSYLKKYNFMDNSKPYDIYRYIINDKRLSKSYCKVILCAFIDNYRNTHDDIDQKVIEKYQIIIRALKNDIAQIESKNIDKNKDIPKWQNLIKIRSKLLKIYNKSRDNKDYLNYLIISLYTYFPRRLDYADMIVWDDKDTIDNDNYNYFNTDDCSFEFRNYKTKNAFHKQQFKVNSKLCDIIKKYIKMNNLIKGDSILGLSKLQLYKRLKHILGYSVDYIRHSYINHFYAKKIMPKSNEIERISNELAHSVQQNLRYRKY